MKVAGYRQPKSQTSVNVHLLPTYFTCHVEGVPHPPTVTPHLYSFRFRRETPPATQGGAVIRISTPPANSALAHARTLHQIEQLAALFSKSSQLLLHLVPRVQQDGVVVVSFQFPRYVRKGLDFPKASPHDAGGWK